MWDTLTNPANAPTINALGFLFGVAGFVITLGGFVLGYFRLRRVETAAAAAKSAAENVRLRIVQYDAASDLSDARAGLSMARRNLSSEGWADVAESYDDVRRAIIRASQAISPEETGLTGQVNRMVDQIEKICTVIDRWLDDPTRPAPDKVGTKKLIRSHEGLVLRAQQQFQQRASR